MAHHALSSPFVSLRLRAFVLIVCPCPMQLAAPRDTYRVYFTSTWRRLAADSSTASQMTAFL